MPQKTLKKKMQQNKVKSAKNAKKNIRKAFPQEEKLNLKDPHLNAIKKGNFNITKVINKNIESFALAKAKIGLFFSPFFKIII